MSSLSQSRVGTSIVVVDTSHSPFARLRPLGLADVRINAAFWTPRLEINRTATIPFAYEQCESMGHLDNFRCVIGQYDGPFQGRYFNDAAPYLVRDKSLFAMIDLEEDCCSKFAK